MEVKPITLPSSSTMHNVATGSGEGGNVMAPEFEVAKVLQNAANVLDSDEFKAALKNDLKNLPASPSLEDTRFFESISIPYNFLRNLQYSFAIDAWEKIFMLIKEIDEDRFLIMHKGTPYYFCGIAAFMMKDYERAVFYMDAAFAEDFKNYDIFNLDPKTAPAALFLTLDAKKQGQAAKPLVEQTMKLMIESLANFYEESKEEMTLKQLKNSFLLKSIDQSPEWRSAVTALFSFVLERDSRKREFELRSAHGGTQEPFFLHLFKGCLLFETLLKLSPKWKEEREKSDGNKSEIEQLGDVLQNKAINELLKIDLLFADVKVESFDKVVTFRNKQKVFHNRIVWTTYGIRNKTGHSLAWETEMTTEDFNNLSDDILFAILLVLQKLF